MGSSSGDELFYYKFASSADSTVKVFLEVLSPSVGILGTSGLGSVVLVQVIILTRWFCLILTLRLTEAWFGLIHR